MRKRTCLKKIAVLFCITVLMLAGCGKKGLSAEDIVGTWTYFDETGNGFDVTYTFNSDGTISTSMAGVSVSDGTYTVAGDSINYTLTGRNGKSDSGSWSAELDGDNLILTSSTGIVRTYEKQ